MEGGFVVSGGPIAISLRYCLSTFDDFAIDPRGQDTTLLLSKRMSSCDAGLVLVGVLSSWESEC